MLIDLHRRRTGQASILIGSRKVSRSTINDDSKNKSSFVKRWFTMAASAAKIKQQNCDICGKAAFRAKPMLVSARAVRTFEKTWPSRGQTTTRDKPFLRLSSSGAPSWRANDSLSRSTVLIATIQPTPRRKVVRGIVSDGLEYRPQVERVSDGRCSQQRSILLLNILYKRGRNETRFAANVLLRFARIDLELVGNCQTEEYSTEFYKTNVGY